MAWTLVQSPAGQGTGNGSGQRSLAFGSNVATGNLLVAAISMFNNSSATAAVSDTLGNTWTQLGSYSKEGSFEVVSLWGTLAGVSSGGADTVKFTPSVSVYAGFCIVEFSPGAGLAAPFTVDGSATNFSGSNTTSLSSGNVTVAGSNELVLTAFEQDKGATLTLTPGTGFSQAASQPNSSSFQACYLDYLLNAASASSPFNDQATLSGASNYSALGVSIKATASGGGGGLWPWFAADMVGGCRG